MGYSWRDFRRFGSADYLVICSGSAFTFTTPTLPTAPLEQTRVVSYPFPLCTLLSVKMPEVAQLPLSQQDVTTLQNMIASIAIEALSSGE